MQAATMTRELVMAHDAIDTTIDVQLWVRRAVRVAFLLAGIATTAWIMGQYGTLLVYGLPAPFLKRVVTGAPAQVEAAA